MCVCIVLSESTKDASLKTIKLVLDVDFLITCKSHDIPTFKLFTHRCNYTCVIN